MLGAGARLAVVGSYLADVIGKSENENENENENISGGSSGRGDHLLAAFSQALEPLVAAAS